MCTSFWFASHPGVLMLDAALRICEQKQTRVKEAQKKLRGEEAKLKEQPGNEARLKEVSDEKRKLWLELKKLWQEEWKTLRPKRDAFYEENKIPLPNKNNKDNEKKPNDVDPGSNHNGVNGNVYNNNDDGSCCYSSDYGGNNDEYLAQLCDGGEHYPHGHDERQVERGHYHYNKGDRQGYRQGQLRMKKVYVPKVKASSDAGTEAEEKPEENGASATTMEQKEASADNADVVPASESDKSAG